MSLTIKKNLKKLLVFSLAFIFDQYQKLSIKNYYRAFYMPGAPIKRESLHKLVYQMTKIKEIKKEIKNGEVYLNLTSKGGSFFNERVSLKKLSDREWDGYWRLVIFDIKEIDRRTRDKLRNKLKEWGFVMWQESVYISPHPILKEIDEFLKIKKLFPKVVTMESKLVGIKNHDRFAWIVFNLGSLEKDYLKIKNEILNLKKEKTKNKDIRIIIEKYKNIVLKDPFLPKGLIKENWPREEIKYILKDIFFDYIDKR